MLERISVNWEHFVESSDREAYTAAMVELGVLAEKHIYFRLLYTRSFGCFSVRRAALPRDRRVPSVDKKADRRPDFQGVPQGV